MSSFALFCSVFGFVVLLLVVIGCLIDRAGGYRRRLAPSAQAAQGVAPMSAFSRAMRRPLHMLTIRPHVPVRVMPSRPTDEQWQALFNARVRANLERRGITRTHQSADVLPFFLCKQAN